MSRSLPSSRPTRLDPSTDIVLRTTVPSAIISATLEAQHTLPMRRVHLRSCPVLQPARFDLEIFGGPKLSRRSERRAWRWIASDKSCSVQQAGPPATIRG